VVVLLESLGGRREHFQLVDGPRDQRGVGLAEVALRQAVAWRVVRSIGRLVSVHLGLLLLAAFLIDDWRRHEIWIVPHVYLGVGGLEASLAHNLALRCHLDLDWYLSLALALLHNLLLDIFDEPLRVCVVRGEFRGVNSSGAGKGKVLLEVLLRFLIHGVGNVNVGLHEEVIDVISLDALDGGSLGRNLAVDPHELLLQFLLLCLLLLLLHLHCGVVERGPSGSCDVEAFLRSHLL